MRKTHKDVRFYIQTGPRTMRGFKSIGDALLAAFQHSNMSKKPAYINVTISSRAGARWLGGEDTVRQYQKAGEGTVEQTITIQASVSKMTGV